MQVAAKVETALARLLAKGVVKKVHAGAFSGYEDGLQPAGSSVTVAVQGDPEAHRAEIERLVSEAGLSDVRLSITRWPGVGETRR